MKGLLATARPLISNRSFSVTAKALLRKNFSGIYPPICTPFNKDEEIAWSKLQGNLEKLNKTNVSGYLVEGSNGEFCFMDDRERVELVEKVREFSDGDKLVLAGSGCESTRNTIKMTQKMAEVGADAAVVITPHFFKASMTAPALKKHFESVADSSPIPVILYSVPKNTGVDLPAEVAIELSSHPNIVGIKDSGGDITKIETIVAGTKDENFFTLAGSAGFLLAALNVGADGGILALANVLPNQCVQLKELKDSGKEKEAEELQYRLLAPNKAVTAQFGVAGLKTVMDWAGFYGGPVRRPLLPLDPSDHETLKTAFTSNGFDL